MKKRNKISKPYQDTKNVPKNFLKAILRYIKENQSTVKKFLKTDYQFKKMITRMEVRKDKVVSIKQLRELLTPDPDNEEISNYNKVFRIFFRKFLNEELKQYMLCNKR